MRVRASPEAVSLVREHGGKLYVWARRSRCCGSALTLLEATSDPGERTFNRFEVDGIEVYLDERLRPDELELAVGGFRSRQVRAYWNGCAYVV
jgi:hypothetical protein